MADKQIFVLHGSRRSYHVQATVLPDDATDKSLTWKTSASDVATVAPGQDGAVVTLTGKAGNFDLTATSNAAPTVSDTLNCEVQVVKATAVQIAGLPTSFGPKERSFQLYPTFTPADPSDDRVTWSCDNPDVATITDDGQISFTGYAGNANITCKMVGQADIANRFGIQVKSDGTVNKLNGMAFPTEGAKYFGSHVDPDDPTILDMRIPTSTQTSTWNIPYSFEDGRQYTISFDIRYKPGAKYVTGSGSLCNFLPGWDGLDMDYSTLTDDWQHKSFTFGPVKNVGKLIAFISDKSSAETDIQLRNILVTDVTGGGQVSNALHYGSFDWKTLGFDTDSDVLMLTCSDVKQGDLTPSVAYKPNRILHLIKGHKYQMSCDEQSDSPNTNGFIFLSLNREWSLSLGIWQPYSKDWQSKSGTFTADRTGNFKLTPQVSKAIGTFKLRNFRLDDLTLGTNGGGK